LAESKVTDRAKIVSENRAKASKVEGEIYGMLVKSGFYFRRFRGFCDLIGRVGGMWILVEIKISEDGENRIRVSPFNTRMTLRMAKDLKGIVYLVIKLNGDYLYMRGERLMSFVANRLAKSTTIRLGKWMDALRPINELIKELEALKEVKYNQ